VAIIVQTAVALAWADDGPAGVAVGEKLGKIGKA
jgi:hypothetical protein